jgi:hypothetical protein
LAGARSEKRNIALRLPRHPPHPTMPFRAVSNRAPVPAFDMAPRLLRPLTIRTRRSASLPRGRADLRVGRSLEHLSILPEQCLSFESGKSKILRRLFDRNTVISCLMNPIFHRLAVARLPRAFGQLLMGVRSCGVPSVRISDPPGVARRLFLRSCVTSGLMHATRGLSVTSSSCPTMCIFSPRRGKGRGSRLSGGLPFGRTVSANVPRTLRGDGSAASFIIVCEANRTIWTRSPTCI